MMGTRHSQFFNAPQGTSSKTSETVVDGHIHGAGGGGDAPETHHSTQGRNVEIVQTRLDSAKKGSLLPMHTLLFAQKIPNYPLIKTVVEDNKGAFETAIADLDPNKDHDYEVLKELFILSALLGSKNVLSKLKQFDITVDSEILNMALWSGDFEGAELDYFMNHVSPTYNSIRHAISSGNINVLAQVFEKNPRLKANSEHLTAVDGLTKTVIEKNQMISLLQLHSALPTAGIGHSKLVNESKEPEEDHSRQLGLR